MVTESFDEIRKVSTDGLVMVCLDCCGDGLHGTFSPSDPEDKPLLRFDVFRLCVEGEEFDVGAVDEDDYEPGDWMYLEGSSTGTLLSSRDDPDLLDLAAQHILERVAPAAKKFASELGELCKSLRFISTETVQLLHETA